jgi:hypothetical protein
MAAIALRSIMENQGINETADYGLGGEDIFKGKP